MLRVRFSPSSPFLISSSLSPLSRPLPPRLSPIPPHLSPIPPRLPPNERRRREGKLIENIFRRISSKT